MHERKRKCMINTMPANTMPGYRRIASPINQSHSLQYHIAYPCELRKHIMTSFTGKYSFRTRERERESSTTRCTTEATSVNENTNSDRYNPHVRIHVQCFGKRKLPKTSTDINANPVVHFYKYEGGTEPVTAIFLFIPNLKVSFYYISFSIYFFMSNTNMYLYNNPSV